MKNRIFNSELYSALKNRTSDMQVVQALMYEMWRGHALLAPFMPLAQESVKVRIAEGVCLPVFADYASAEGFLAMLEAQSGQKATLKEVPIEELLHKVVFSGGDMFFAMNLGDETAALMPKPVAQSLRMATTSLTGGRMPGEDLRLMRLHMNTLNNAARVRAADRCGCFHCGQMFAPGEVVRFVPEKDGGKTAMCPRCGIDAVLTNLDGEPLTEGLLEELRARFFSESAADEAGLRMMYLQCMKERLQEEKSRSAK